MPTCHLLDSGFSVLIQASLGVTALLSLVCKRYTERPQRPMRIFVYDASKQALGALYAHCLNLLLAISISHIIHPKERDECLWYFINFCIDLLLGIPFNYLLLNIADKLAHMNNWNSLVSGKYIETEKFFNRSYLLQTLLWMGVITISKVLLFYSFIIPLAPYLASAGSYILGPVSHNVNTELIVVMVFIPFSFNIIQFWLQDTFLKGNSQYSQEISAYQLNRRLFTICDSNEVTTI